MCIDKTCKTFYASVADFRRLAPIGSRLIAKLSGQTSGQSHCPRYVSVIHKITLLGLLLMI